MRCSVPGLVIAAALCLPAPLLAGNVLRVGPTRPFTTIQAAIDAARDGDVVLVDPGAYEAFAVAGKGIAILAAVPGVPFSIKPSERTGVRITRTTAQQTVTIQGWSLDVVAGAAAGLIVESCAGPVRIADAWIEPRVDLPGVPMRALVEIVKCDAVWLEDVRVGSSSPRDGWSTRATAVANGGLDDGIAAVLSAASRVRMARCSLQGLRNLNTPIPTAWGGDAVRLIGGSLLRIDGSPTLLAGGAGRGFGGSAVHHVDSVSRIDVLSCGIDFGALVRGPGPLPGGLLARNHDRGQFAPGVERFVPACLFESFGEVLVPSQIPIGGSASVQVRSFFVRTFWLLLGPPDVARVPGLENTAFHDFSSPFATVVTAGVLAQNGTASVWLAPPSMPDLIGFQFALQAVLGPPSGQTVPALSWSMAAGVVLVP